MRPSNPFFAARYFAAASLAGLAGFVVAAWLGQSWRVDAAYAVVALGAAGIARLEADRVRRSARRRRVYRVVADRMLLARVLEGTESRISGTLNLLNLQNDEVPVSEIGDVRKALSAS